MWIGVWVVLEDMRTSMMAEVDFTKVGPAMCVAGLLVYWPLHTRCSWCEFMLARHAGRHAEALLLPPVTPSPSSPPFLPRCPAPYPAPSPLPHAPQEAQHIAHFTTFLDSRGYRAIATTPFVYSQLSSKRWVPGKWACFKCCVGHPQSPGCLHAAFHHAIPVQPAVQQAVG